MQCNRVKWMEVFLISFFDLVNKTATFIDIFDRKTFGTPFKYQENRRKCGLQYFHNFTSLVIFFKSNMFVRPSSDFLLIVNTRQQHTII